MTSLSIDQLFVLLVEPSPMQRRIIERTLEAQGIRALAHCEAGADALERLAHEPIDLVVSAMYLPDMTGTDLVHQIRAADRGADTPFMLVSSETRFRLLDPIRQAGVVGILPKPFSDAELRTALATTLDLLDDAPEPAEDQALDMKVLLVDDSPLARKHIARVLGSLGIDAIDEAADGVEAADMLERHYYDFVVTDYNMPRMDGRELVEHVRHASAQASIPVLMVTSESNSKRLAAVQQSGVSAICDKPFEPATVRQLIRQMMREG
jgi:two-component system chemotaxis response regulator CheY